MAMTQIIIKMPLPPPRKLSSPIPAPPKSILQLGDQLVVNQLVRPEIQDGVLGRVAEESNGAEDFCVVFSFSALCAVVVVFGAVVDVEDALEARVEGSDVVVWACSVVVIVMVMALSWTGRAAVVSSGVR